MIKAVSIWLAFCVLATQLGWRSDSVHTDVIAAESKSQIDDSCAYQATSCDHQDQPVKQDAPGDVVDGKQDSETGTPEDEPLNPILARAALPDMSGRLTRPVSMSRVLALSIRAQAVERQRDPRGPQPERVAAAARCRTSRLLAMARATRPHAPPLV